eukprot:scaffold109754_cov43-Cyclotella_meneghiniana.AAC.1
MKIALVSILNLALVATASAAKGPGKMSDESLPAVAPMKHGLRAAAGTKTAWAGVIPEDIEWCTPCMDADICSCPAAEEGCSIEKYYQNECYYKLKECCGIGA